MQLQSCQDEETAFESISAEEVVHQRWQNEATQSITSYTDSGGKGPSFLKVEGDYKDAWCGGQSCPKTCSVNIAIILLSPYQCLTKFNS